jgi:hypothetical protein
MGQRTDLRFRIPILMEALKPFAEYARLNPSAGEDRDEVVPDGVFTMGECRNALRALQAVEETFADRSPTPTPSQTGGCE